MRLKVQEAMAKKQAAPLSEAALQEQLQAKRQDAEERIALFNVALQYNPNDALAHYGKGNLLRELGELELAHAAFQAATEGNPNHTLAWLQRAECGYDLLNETDCRYSLQEGIRIASQRGDLQPLTKLQALQAKLGA
jgi:tetratricopeptide (TPR) repeat protein